MPRKGRKYIAVYPSEEQYFELKKLAEESGKSVSKFILEKLGLSIVGSEDAPRAKEPEKPKEPQKKVKVPAYVGEKVVDGVHRGPPRALTTKEKQAWHRKQKRK